MASAVEVCNDALTRLGAAPILSLDENSTAGALCLRQFALCRDHVLSRYPWNCATGRVRLAADPVAPAWGYTAAFTLPADCLRVLRVADDERGVSWRVESGAVLADGAGPLDIQYIRRLEDVGAWSPGLADAVAAQLAARIAYGLTGNASMAQAMAQMAEQAFVLAKRLDAIEQSQDEEVGATLWADARFTSTGQSPARASRGSGTTSSSSSTPTVTTTVPVFGP